MSAAEATTEGAAVPRAPATLSKYRAYTEALMERRAAEEWLSHIGKRGRNEYLALSPVHCKVAMMIAGQYSEGGNNYRESPSPFNAVLIAVLVEQFPKISESVMERLRRRERVALIEAAGEIRDVSAAITAAQAEA